MFLQIEALILLCLPFFLTQVNIYLSLPVCFWRSDPATVNITDEMSKGSFGSVWKNVNPAEATKKEPSAKRYADPHYCYISRSVSLTTSEAFNPNACMLLQCEKVVNFREIVFVHWSKQWQVFIILQLWNIYCMFFQETKELVCLDKKGLSKSSPALCWFPTG